MRKKRELDLQVVPGQPRDGSGRLRIHFFVEDERGPISTFLVSKFTRLGPVQMGGKKGFIACDRERKNVDPVVMEDGYIQPYLHSQDVRAVSCPECLQTTFAEEQREKNRLAAASGGVSIPEPQRGNNGLAAASDSVSIPEPQRG